MALTKPQAEQIQFTSGGGTTDLQTKVTELNTAVTNPDADYGSITTTPVAGGSKRVKIRRGTAAQHSTFTGALGEITVKTDTNEIVVHDGVTPGGFTGGGYMPAGTGAVATTVQAKLRELLVSVSDDGAVGDGVDQTELIQSVCNKLKPGDTLYFPQCANRWKFTSIVINKPFIKVRGPGIVDGTIIFQSSSDPTYGREMYFDVEGVTFNGIGQNTNDHIVLKNLFYGRVSNCTFREGNACIRVPQNTLDNQYQNVGRIVVSNNNYQGCNYLVAIEPTNANYLEAGADWIVSDNQGLCYYDHVSAANMDGITIDSNIFFFPYDVGAPYMATKGACVSISRGAHIMVTNNKCFESGTNSIGLTDCVYFKIEGNEHATPGQRVESAAIAVTYATLPVANIGVIANESINKSSGAGITLGENCRSITVHGNNIFEPGNNDKYYGPAYTPNRKGVVVQIQSGNQNIHASDNLTTYGVYDFYDGALNTNTYRNNKLQDALGNLTVVDRANILLSASGANRQLVADKYDIAVLTGSAYFEVNSITQNAFGAQYKVFTLYFDTANGVVGPPTANLILKGGVSATVPQNGVMTFLLQDGGKAIELSRNF